MVLDGQMGGKSFKGWLWYMYVQGGERTEKFGGREYWVAGAIEDFECQPFLLWFLSC